jgi:hypothetical protein
MSSAGSGFAAFRGPIDRRVFEPGFELWLRVSGAVRRLSLAVVTLPDRGPNAEPLPPEFFRFPRF